MIAAAVHELPLGLVSPLVSTGNGTSSECSFSGNGACGDAWQGVVVELTRLKQLGEDWDGQGAAPIDPANVARGIAVVERMRVWPQALPPDQVVPGVTGEVFLIWQRPGLLVEAEIGASDQIDWLLIVEGQPARQWQTNLQETWLLAPVLTAFRDANGVTTP